MRLRQFIIDWMLPIVMLLGIGIYLLFHNITLFDGIAGWYAPHNNDVLPACMFLVLFTTFCKVDFKKLRPVKWHLWMGTIQLLSVMLYAWVINVTHVGGEGLVLLESMLVCMVCPCASAATVVTAKLGGSLEEMTSFTFLSNIFSAFLISFFFPMLPRESHSEVLSFLPMFMRILWRVSCVLMLPMLVAFIVKHCFKRLHRAIVSVPDLSYLLWGVSLMIVSATTAKNISDSLDWASLPFLGTIALLSLFICLLQFVIGRFTGRHLGKTVDCGQALGQKNTTISIWVTTIFLNPLASVGPGCYILWQNTINAIEMVAESRKSKRQHR